MFSKEKYLFPDIAYGKYTCTDMYLGCFGVGEIQWNKKNFLACENM